MSPFFWNKWSISQYFVFPHSGFLWLYHVLTFKKNRKTQDYKSEHIFMKKADYEQYGENHNNCNSICTGCFPQFFLQSSASHAPILPSTHSQVTTYQETMQWKAHCERDPDLTNQKPFSQGFYEKPSLLKILIPLSSILLYTSKLLQHEDSYQNQQIENPKGTNTPQ